MIFEFYFDLILIILVIPHNTQTPSMDTALISTDYAPSNTPRCQLCKNIILR